MNPNPDDRARGRKPDPDEETQSRRPATGSSANRAPILAAADTLGERYRIESFVARGGMGEVYRAIDLDLGVPVALKTIRQDIAADSHSLRRFKQEVLLARSVTHPNVCRIYDLGRDDVRAISFLTMEYLDGVTLFSRIRSHGRLPTTEILPLLEQLVEALDAAHRAGVVHRDFKSQNVMLVKEGTGERAVITDFGLAVHAMKAADGSSDGESPTAAIEETTSPAVTDLGYPIVVTSPAGTVAYMSPEQVAGGPVGPASDLYSLGVVFYEMVTGRTPFRGRVRQEVERAQLEEPPVAPSTFAPIDTVWEEMILRLLSKKPSDRPPRGRDVILALEGRSQETTTTQYSLPPERDAFVGRREELDFLVSHLEGDTSAPRSDAFDDDRGRPIRKTSPVAAVQPERLLTLLGPGGIGKTRLSVRYGWERLAWWPGGVWFCDLADARTFDGMTQSVAAALDVTLGRTDPVTQLGHAIASHGRCLIILDNFEQIASDGRLALEQWLARATEARFLVTSRERLRLVGEVVHEVEPLDPGTLGLELFELRARSHRPGFHVDETNRGQASELIRALDGLPLAIELAASRLRTLSLEQIQKRLTDRFRVLSGGQRGRHETLRAALDWSWDLLQLSERSAMLQASVFEGGFTLEAAESVIDLGAEQDAPLVLDVVQSLVDKSWLRMTVTHGTPRFDAYETVREYVSMQTKVAVSRAPEDSALFVSERDTEIRHGSLFASMGSEVALEALDGHGGVAKRAALQSELENLIAACRRAIRRGDEPTATGTYMAASEVLALRGPFRVSVRLGRDVLALARQPALRARVLRSVALAERLMGDMEAARVHLDAALTACRDLGDRRSEGVVLNHLGLLHENMGQVEDARSFYETALAIHREVGHRRFEGIVLGNLGNLHAEAGRATEALDHYRNALAIDRDVGNRRFEAIILGNLANLECDLGQTAQARGHYRAALAIHREVGNRRGEGIVQVNLGSMDHSQGRMDEARDNYEAALTIHREVGDRRMEGNALGNLGGLYFDRGWLDDAVRCDEAALVIHREVGDRPGEGVVLGNLGNLYERRGEIEQARHCYESALAIHREVGDRPSEAIMLSGLGGLCQLEGRSEEAGRYYETALAIAREVGHRREEGIVLGDLGSFYLAGQETVKALEIYEEALAIHREVGNRHFEGIALGQLSKAHQAEGRIDEARACLETSVSLLREVSDTFELGLVLCELAELELQEGDRVVAQLALAEAKSIAKSLASPKSKLAGRLEEIRKSLGGDVEPP